jgi:hypothetical protein
MVMSKKSSWFAQQYGTGPHAPGHHFEIARDCLPLEITGLFEIKHCDAHDASADCQLHALLTVLLYSCYVDEYSCEFDDENIEAACRGNIYIYVLGPHFGIDSILPKCVAAFAKAMDFLKKDTELFPNFINLVLRYDRNRRSRRATCGGQKPSAVVRQGRACWTSNGFDQALQAKHSHEGDAQSHTRYRSTSLRSSWIEPRHCTARRAFYRTRKHLTYARRLTWYRNAGVVHSEADAQPLKDCGFNADFPPMANISQIDAGSAVTRWKCQGCSHVWHTSSATVRCATLDNCTNCNYIGMRPKLIVLG